MLNLEKEAMINSIKNLINNKVETGDEEEEEE